MTYNRDIRPILSDNCFACHGPDRNKRQANMRLDIREDALAHGAVVAGKPQASKLVARISAAEDAGVMPPVEFHKKLTAAQKETLKKWIAQGAPYEAHWAYIAPVRSPGPAIRDSRYPIRNPVDAFIAARLREKGVRPSPEADRRALIRRVTLDLTGLPPATKEVEAFLADRSPDAYEKVVDRLLASPRYGERMAVPWLDLVRYADTVGFHGDQNQNAWAYRDYVIDSFNKDKPFDQFTVEQLAGDLLPNPTPEQRTATCFTRLTMMTREGGAQPKEYLAKYQADRVRTVGMAWLGSTLACCECHDHKFDPFTQKDFYSLGAFFADLKQWGVYADYGYTPNPDLRGFNNDFPFPPEIKVVSPYLKERIRRQTARITELAAQTEAVLQKDPAARAGYDAWREAAAAFLGRYSDGWETPPPDAETAVPSAPRPKKGSKAAPKPAAMPPAGAATAAYRLDPDRSVTLTDAIPTDLDLELNPETRWIAALRVEALPSPEHGGTVFRSGAEAMVTVTAAVERAGGRTEPVSFRYAGTDLSEPRYRSGFEIVGVHSGWKLSAAHKSDAQVSVWLPSTPVPLGPEDRLSVTFPAIQAGRVRVSVSPFVPDDPGSAILPVNLHRAMAQPDAGSAKETALRAYLLGTAWNAEAFAKAKAFEADVVECRDGITPVMVAEAAAQPMTMRVLPRGNWQDESGAVVQPAVPHFLPGYQPEPAHRLTRLDLAKWIVSPENPLTARVFVNRLWKQFFGNGLATQEDLGAQGEWPTHPELLDWLASAFAGVHSPRSRVDGGPGTSDSGLNLRWRIKPLVRLLVTSATYRQSSNLRPELRDADPNNRLLASQNPRRLEAELVRDNALAIAGLLHEDLGGPPVHPYQPAGYYVSIQFPDRTYTPETDERQWRRGVYMHWQRTFLHPALLNFDAPSREDCIASRTMANTPQQALTLLNDPEFVEAARVFAASLLAAKTGSAGASPSRVPAGDAERIDLAYQRALARPAKAREKESLLRFLARMREEYRQRPEDAKKLLGVGFAPSPAEADPVELAAWSSVCRVVLNLQETITRY